MLLHTPLLATHLASEATAGRTCARVIIVLATAIPRTAACSHVLGSWTPSSDRLGATRVWGRPPRLMLRLHGPAITLTMSSPRMWAPAGPVEIRHVALHRFALTSSVCKGLSDPPLCDKLSCSLTVPQSSGTRTLYLCSLPLAHAMGRVTHAHNCARAEQ